jgi:crotonobetainyl-CoA:carnitine CoA-transferase CaiB-like acyl-CoA transferase
MRERPGLSRQPPQLGEHSSEVLTEAGFDQGEIDRLIRDKVVVAGG